jgi:hypothetical protein
LDAFAWPGDGGNPRTMSNLRECFNGLSSATIHCTSRTTSYLSFRYTHYFGSVTCSVYHRSHHPGRMQIALQAITGIRFQQLAEVVSTVRDGERKRRIKSAQLHIFSFLPSKQMRREDIVIASGNPHDATHAEKPPKKRPLVQPAEKRRLRR